MIQTRHWRPSRRGLMFLVVGIQVLILAVIVASQEINRALDSSFPVELEVGQAYAQKDPFRGASISGRPALDLGVAKVSLPPTPLEAGDKVLAVFSVESSGPPRIVAVERQGRGTDPPFRRERFSIPGTVRREGDRGSVSSARAMVVRVGKPPVAVELDLPASIPVDESALEQLSGPSVVRANLRQGFLGHRYFDHIRVTGQAWTDEMSFTYDIARDRLVVFAAEGMSFTRVRRTDDQPLRTRLFFFDGTGKELSSTQVAGRLIYGVISPVDGMLWALLATERWGHSTVQLARVGEGGEILQRGPQIIHAQIVGFDTGDGGLWVLAGLPNRPRGTPYFVERVTIGGVQAPRLGPFSSKPRKVLTHDKNIWVIEADQHRVTRFDLTGRAEKEYRDVNQPTGIAIDAGSLIAVEAAETQLSKFSMEGQPLWRIPRFEGISWILPEPGTGSGWVGARRFEGRGGGVFRYNSDGKISQAIPVTPSRKTEFGWSRTHLAPDAIRARTTGRLYIRENQAIVIATPNGTVLKRVEGFRYPTERRVRS